ncbi:MAG: phage major capsid protein [Clostridia bacterium]|nr:phage major capsid protein [Clostridia bacterium]
MKLTQEQLAELIAKVFAGIDEKHKARKEAGEDVGEITNEEILAEVTDILSGIEYTEDGEGEDPAAAPEEKAEAEGSAITPELIAKVVEALEGIKSASAEPETKTEQQTQEPEKKSAPAPTQRKYASIFMSQGASRDGCSQAIGFKTRIANMSAPERRKTAYGMFGRSVKCINASGGDAEKAAYIAEHKFDDREMAREFKALSATSPADGGYLVPEVYANEIIELLYPTTVIYALGARRLGMANGNLNIPKIKAGSRALFNGEERKIPKSAPKFGNLKLSAKKLTALIPMSNDLLRSTNFDNDVIVGQDITQQMALGVDYGALLGAGGEFQPTGITQNKNVLNIDVTSIGTDYASAQGELTPAFPNYLVAAVLKNNVYATGLGFVFNTSVEQYFKSLRDNSGGFIFADEMNSQGTLAGYPYKATNLLETVGGKTQIIFGNWNDLIIGEQGALEIETSREGAWTDDAGHLVSAFENDQTLIRAIDNVDIGLRHDESFAVASKVSVPV